MPFQDPKPEEFKAGQPQFSAEALNKLHRAINRQVRGSGDSTVSDFGDRVVVSSQSINPQLPSHTHYIDQFVIIEEWENWLKCIPLALAINVVGIGTWPNVFTYTPILFAGLASTPNISVPFVYVAKPFLLQQAPWGAVPISYYEATIAEISYPTVNKRIVAGYVNITLSSGSFYETQVIVPGYLLGELIVAARCVTGYVVPGPDPDNPQVGEIPIEWMDLNTGGRTWGLDVNTPGG